MRAVILAGGRGTRLAPITAVLPKPLVPVGEMPILEIVVRQLAAAGFTRATLTLGYLGELIRAFFATHKRLTRLMDVDFVQEEQPTGTAGSLTLVEGLDETFLVMNGDVLTTLDYQELIRFHHAEGAVLTIASHRKRVKIDLGVMELDSSGRRVTGYIEKPEKTYPVSMGVYVYEPRALDFIPRNEYFDFPSLVLRLIAAGERVACFANDSLWLDIGRHEDYAQAQEVFERERARFRLAGLDVDEGR
jgi:NDP-sugar pyrophosphorylase family protein